ncbi:unnamed protein product [Mytilus coruscus]|uniref:Fibronectin type-III domain-containing protein n=1 Tax=Mytilus coruscus TaxID=42192 RepID=A0A6J8BGG4_MYTCO|nr:unnamed protein product [Mytilus coruscus]
MKALYLEKVQSLSSKHEYEGSILFEPLPPKHLKAASDFDGIHITWSIPEYPVIDKIHHSILEVNREIINVAPDKTCSNISNVYPSTYYTIRMATSARSGSENKSDGNPSSGFQTKSEYTDELKCKTTEPLPPKHLKAASDFDGIHITWSISEYPVIDKIHHFILEVNREIINVAPDKTCSNISNVYPSTYYTIRMATSARSGSEIKSDGNPSSGFQTKSEYTDELKCKTTGMALINKNKVKPSIVFQNSLSTGGVV